MASEADTCTEIVSSKGTVKDFELGAKTMKSERTTFILITALVSVVALLPYRSLDTRAVEMIA
jgi:hypothetical protein